MRIEVLHFLMPDWLKKRSENFTFVNEEIGDFAITTIPPIIVRQDDAF